jgi:hypothetical protein
MTRSQTARTVAATLGRAALASLTCVVIAQPSEAADTTSSSTFVQGKCPQVVTGRVVLKMDIICHDTDGLIVGANNTTIFLNGYSIKCTDPLGYKFSCQDVIVVEPVLLPLTGTTTTTAESEDTREIGIDTNRKSNVQIIGPGQVQGFDVGVRLLGPADKVVLKKVNVTGPDGDADLATETSATVIPNRPETDGILIKNFVEHGRCYNDGHHTNCRCNDDDHAHEVDVQTNSVDNHTVGIKIENSSRVFVRMNFIHDNNEGAESETSFRQNHGLLVCASPSVEAQELTNCKVGVSRRNRIHTNLVVDNGMNASFPDSDPDGALTMTGNVRDNLITHNTVLGNNGDGVSVRDGAAANRISNNIVLYNSTTETTDEYVVGDPAEEPRRFYDIAARAAGPYNSINPNNKCLTDSPGVDQAVCNQGENEEWK